MCGILCVVSGLHVDCTRIHAPEAAAERACAPAPAAPDAAAVSEDDFLAGLRRRGPDATDHAAVELGSCATLSLTGTLLQLRGDAPAAAIQRDAAGSLLCFNGEVFGGLQVAAAQNDSAVLMRALAAAPVPKVLSAVRGPWALVLWHAPTRTLWFGRDVLGRRSLLLHRPDAYDPRLILASVAPLTVAASSSWEELPPGLYSLQVEHGAVLAHSWEDPELLALAAYSRQNSSVDSLPAPTPRTHADELLHALDSAVARRVARGGAVAAAPGAASVLILFSGGLDSSLLAALAHRHVPAAEPIDLATVCFSGGTSRDRLAALDALQELRNLAPHRTWRLLEVDGSLAMMAEHRQRMLQLLHPCSTVMDRNIGFALWLAARGTGVCGGSPCTSAARIALLGTGADEQAAGYSRHRATFQHGGECALVAELEADVRRLWHRNLGRDDRLLSDCGREARFPFLDESVMACLARIPLAEVTNMAQPAGVGDKRVLRDIARGIGLHNAAARVKRAIQFGSGLGKAANVQDFGSGRAANARGGGTCSAY